jgi:hypothetical protein
MEKAGWSDVVPGTLVTCGLAKVQPPAVKTSGSDVSKSDVIRLPFTCFGLDIPDWAKLSVFFAKPQKNS